MQFAHVGIEVLDLERMSRFYREALGLQTALSIERNEPWLGEIVGCPGAQATIEHLQNSGSELRLELLEYQPDYSSLQMHCALLVPDIALAIESWENAGGTIVSCPAPVTIPDGPNAGTKVIYLRDPEGNLVELLEKPSSSA